MKRKITLFSLLISFVLCTSMFCVSVFASSDNSETLAMQYEVNTTSYYVGEKIMMPKVQPVFPDKVSNILITAVKPSGAQETANGYYLFADEAGTYKFYITAYGVNGGSYTESFLIDTQVSEAPVMVLEPSLPAAFISGKTYQLPAVRFIDYNATTPTDCAYTVKTVDVDGKETAVQNGSITPSTAVNTAPLSIVYTSTSDVTGQSNTVMFDVPILDALEYVSGYPHYDYAKLFYTTGGCSSFDNNGVRFDFDDDAGFYFANKVNAAFKTTFAPVEGLNACDEVTITLTDCVDKDIAVDFKFIKGEMGSDKSLLSINGAAAFEIDGSFYDYSNGITLSYNNLTQSVIGSNGSAIASVTKTKYGETFNGFTSKTVYVAYTVSSVHAASGLYVKRISSHYFSADGYDAVSPFVVLDTYITNCVEEGGTVKVPKAFAIDVADANPVAKVTVTKKGSNEVVVDKSGVRLYEVLTDKDYYFDVPTVGDYSIHYIAEDESGNEYTAGWYTVYVFDVTAPTIKMNGTIPSEVKLGGTIKVPSYTASDNNGNLVSTTIYVISPGGGYTKLKAGDTFKFNKKGKYYFHYSVFDTFYNVTTADFVTECK